LARSRVDLLATGKAINGQGNQLFSRRRKLLASPSYIVAKKE
jgi:hypothetical protein